jgi:hypothetical protein
MSLERHFSHRTAFTSADLVSPCSAYVKGSSSVESGVRRRLPGSWYSHRVLPHEVSPAPASTSTSVRQRRENCLLSDKKGGKVTWLHARSRTCSASDRRRRIRGRGFRSISMPAAHPTRGAGPWHLLRAGIWVQESAATETCGRG